MIQCSFLVFFVHKMSRLDFINIGTPLTGLHYHRKHRFLEITTLAPP